MKKPSSLVYSLFPNNKSLTSFLISVKMDLESKVIGFQFEPERSISNHKRFFQDSSGEGDAMLWSDTCLTGKIATLAFGASVWLAPLWKQKRNVGTVKKWRRFSKFNLQGIFVLSQAIILWELQKQSHRGVLLK